MTRRLRSVVVPAVVAVALFAGCGVQTDDGPRDISAQAVPFDLLAPTSSSSTTTTSPAATATIPVYLVNSQDLLVEVRRRVAMPVTITDVVSELLKGVTPEEAQQGLRSAITAGTQLRNADLDLQTGVVVVDLTGGFADVIAGAQRLALAQVVYTATALRTVNGVLFELDGEPVEVPDGEGATKATPLSRRDYVRFDAEVAATSTTTSTPGP